MTLKNTEDTNAVFKIINRQSFSDHDECIEITTEGKYYIKNGKHYLLYKEYSDLGEISVMIKAEPDKVSIRRSGACTAVMNYRENIKEEVLYRLPYGNIVFDLTTNALDNCLADEGGILRIEYDIALNGEAYGNEIIIEVNTGTED